LDKTLLNHIKRFWPIDQLTVTRQFIVCFSPKC